MARRDIMSSPVAEALPVLRFLGFGAWEAWVLLCFNSIELSRLFPSEYQTILVFVMYMASTIGMIATLFVAALCWRRFSKLVARRRFVVAAGVAACVATIVTGFAGYVLSVPLFVVISLFTGVATAALCLRMGYVYGRISLIDSLVAGSLSLMLAAFLYFVGIGIPESWRIFYIGLMPLVASSLLSLRSIEEYPGAFEDGAEGAEGEAQPSAMPPSRPFPRMIFLKVVVACSLVAVTDGIGKGISSYWGDPSAYIAAESSVVFFLGLVGLVIVVYINRESWRCGVKGVYTMLMLLGIAIMLATCFGADIAYLGVGKETLWMMFSCLMAYFAFRYNLPSIRVFAMGQGCYFLFSLLGWLAGNLLAPYYSDTMVHMGLGIGMAFVIVVVMAFVFTEADLAGIMSSTQREEAEEAEGGEGEGEASLAPEPEAAPGLNTAKAMAEPYCLSAREAQIMVLYAQGRSANWIADDLVISKNTVRSHLRAVYAKLDVHSRQELLDFLEE